jgi:putative flippase GtrA
MNTLQTNLQNLLLKRPVILQLLRFMAIGFLNTALDFIILNLISKYFGITAGYRLGGINIIGFSAALIQSYIWNRAWAFGSADQSIDLIRNFWRLIIIGGLGVISILLVIAGARVNAAPIYYLIILALFLLIQIIAWMMFNIGKNQQVSGAHTQQFVSFIIVSLVGLLINSSLVAITSHYLISLSMLSNADLLKNIAKVLATGVSLVWNFIGYKLLVFKR